MPPEKIDLLVIHGMTVPAGDLSIQGPIDLFLNNLDPAAHPSFAELSTFRVSAHLVIDRLGKYYQFVAFDRRAWHAGVSFWQGREKCNDFSIGIELVGTSEIPYTDHQYSSLAHVTRALMGAYPGITRESIVGHSDVAPGRKTDPWPTFDWAKYRGMI